MGLNNNYRKLFDLRFLHHYFLDEAGNKYTGSNTGNLEKRFKNNRLKYDLGKFMRIVPTKRTQKVIADYRGIYRQSKDGICLMLKSNGNKPFIEFDSNFFLDFTIEIIDPLFENYTEIEWDKSKLTYLSNADPVAYVPRVDDGTPEFVPDPDPINVSFSRLSDYRTVNAGAAIDMNLLEALTPQELRNKFGIIRIYLTGESGEMSLIDSSDATAFNSTLPELDVFLKNRKTIWRFIDNKDEPPVHETGGRKPLTENGYIKITSGSGSNKITYPNPTPKIIAKEGGNYYSDVIFKQ